MGGFVLTQVRAVLVACRPFLWGLAELRRRRLRVVVPGTVPCLIILGCVLHVMGCQAIQECLMQKGEYECVILLGFNMANLFVASRYPQAFLVALLQ